MDPGFLSFLTTVAALGVAFSIPVGVLMYVRSRTRRPIAPSEDDLAHLEEAMRGVLDRLEETTQRLGELEERVDFTERVVAQREPPRLDRGDGGERIAE